MHLHAQNHGLTLPWGVLLVWHHHVCLVLPRDNKVDGLPLVAHTSEGVIWPSFDFE